MTERDIFEIIKLDKTPYWSLYAVTGYQKRHVGSFNLEGMSDLPEEQKIEKSINALEQRLHLLKQEKNFVIKLKRGLKSNQDGIFEYAFVSTVGGSAVDDNLSGLASKNPIQLGYMPVDIYQKEKELLQDTLAGQLEALRKENDLRLREVMNEFEFKRKLDQLEQKQKEVKDLKKRYDSKKDLLVDTLGEIIDRTLSKWIGDENLAGTDGDDDDDPRAEKIENFANFLYDSNLTEEQINKIIENVKDVFEDKKIEETGTKNEPGANAGNNTEQSE